MSILSFLKKIILGKEIRKPKRSYVKRMRRSLLSEKLEIGMVFEDLVVLTHPFLGKNDLPRVMVQCKCGIMYSVCIYPLLSGKVKRCRSCAALKGHDMRREKYGASGKRY